MRRSFRLKLAWDDDADEDGDDVDDEDLMLAISSEEYEVFELVGEGNCGLLYNMFHNFIFYYISLNTFPIGFYKYLKFFLKCCSGSL